MSRYPYQPGFRFTDTSREAATKAKKPAIIDREVCLMLLAKARMTADEVAEVMNKSVLSIRPRITELKKQGLIVDTGERRKNRSGVRAAVFTLKV